MARAALAHSGAEPDRRGPRRLRRQRGPSLTFASVRSAHSGPSCSSIFFAEDSAFLHAEQALASSLNGAFARLSRSLRSFACIRLRKRRGSV